MVRLSDFGDTCHSVPVAEIDAHTVDKVFFNDQQDLSWVHKVPDRDYCSSGCPTSIFVETAKAEWVTYGDKVSDSQNVGPHPGWDPS